MKIGIGVVDVQTTAVLYIFLLSDEVTEVPDLDQMFKLTQQEQDLILEEWNEGKVNL